MTNQVGTTSDNRSIIEVDADYTLANTDAIVDVVAADVALTLPCDPLPGQRHLVLASKADVTVEAHFAKTVDGDENNDTRLVPRGKAAEFVFSGKKCRWLSVCCPETPEVV